MIRHVTPGINPSTLIAAGLLSAAFYEIVLRFWQSSFLANDTVHGVWLGACFGLEILGLMLLRRRRSARL
jgi:hypothetical protein